MTLPEVTAEKKTAARTLLLNVEFNNGHLAIAQYVKLARIQVAEIHYEMIQEQQIPDED